MQNSLYSLILLDRAYASFNDKFISALNARKDRVKDIAARVSALGQKVAVLDQAKSRLLISASRKFPLKNDFSSDLSIHFDENFDPKPEELDPHFNKIYGRRLVHNKEELENRLNCSIEDLKKLMKLYKKFSIERDIIAEIASSKRNSDEGYLGKTPSNIDKISEVMLFDSPVNVYSDSHVILSDLQISKPMSKKERERQRRAKEKDKGKKGKDTGKDERGTERKQGDIYQAPNLLVQA